MLSNLRIAKRLFLLNLVAIVGLAILAGFALRETRRVYDAASYSTVNTVPSLAALHRIQQNYGSIVTLVSEHMLSDDPHQMDALETKIGAQRKQLDDAIAAYRALVADDKDKALLDQDVKQLARADEERAQLLVLSRKNGNQASEQMRTLFDSIVNDMTAPLEAHRDYNMSLGNAGANDAREIDSTAQTLEIGVGIVVLGIVLAMGLMIARSITVPVGRALGFAHTMADGDLTRRIDVASKDEIGQLANALNSMADSLQDVVSRVRVGSQAVSTATAQIAAGNLDLSARTEEQAASLQETASSMEQLTSTVRHNADSAQQGLTLSQQASHIAQQGSAEVAGVIGTMSEIRNSSSKIADITGIIDGIAFQTNILALNAAVEAARAGEMGRGFAVVASEVRSLAQRSSSAAKEIKDVIEQSVHIVGEGSVMVEKAGATMEQISRAVSQVSGIIGEIAAASNEQSRGIEQINTAVTQMDEVTQQNAALVEEAAAASQSLDEQGRQLLQTVAFFRVDGANHAALSRPAAAGRYAIG
jgi:methyl-accepting chemotaxis protein